MHTSEHERTILSVARMRYPKRQGICIPLSLFSFIGDQRETLQRLRMYSFNTGTYAIFLL